MVCSIGIIPTNKWQNWPLFFSDPGLSLLLKSEAVAFVTGCPLKVHFLSDTPTFQQEFSEISCPKCCATPEQGKQDSVASACLEAVTEPACCL